MQYETKRACKGASGAIKVVGYCENGSARSYLNSYCFAVIPFKVVGNVVNNFHRTASGRDVFQSIFCSANAGARLSANQTNSPDGCLPGKNFGKTSLDCWELGNWRLKTCWESTQFSS